MVIKSFNALHPARSVARALALLLLAAIFWGATAEVTHHHGAPGRFSTTELSHTGDQSSPERVEAPGEGTSSDKTSIRDECLICQLHQNLFATVFSHTLHTTLATTGVLSSHATPIYYSSQFSSPQQGRAPPFNL